MGEKNVATTPNQPAARREAEIRKLRVVWEGIRRNPRFQYLNRKRMEYDRKGDYRSSQCLFDIAKEFSIGLPVDHRKKSVEISDAEIESLFMRPVLQGRLETIIAANRARGPYVELTFDVDITRPPTTLGIAFEKWMRTVQGVRKKAGLDQPAKKSAGGRYTVHQYYPEDFDEYDAVLKRWKGQGPLPFRAIARERVVVRGDSNIKSYDVDLEAKKLEGAYRRAKWVIEEGFRILL